MVENYVRKSELEIFCHPIKYTFRQGKLRNCYILVYAIYSL